MQNKLKAIKAIIVASFFLAGSVGYAEVVATRDTQIVSAIKTKIAEDKLLSDLNIDVTSQGGIVTLAGTVNTNEELGKLVETAEATPGVNDVKSSHLINRKSQHIFTDAAITAKVKGVYVREKLFGDKDISIMSLNVKTIDGTVYLTGTVESQEEANNALKLAEEVQGVKKVESKVVVTAAA